MTNLWRIETTINGLSGMPAFSRFHFEAEPGLDPEVAATQVRTFWWAIKSYLKDSITVQTLGEVPVIDLATGQIIDVLSITPPDAVLGTDTGESLPYATQALVRFTTGQYVNGRQLRGRMFVPGATEANSSGGVPASGYVSTLASAAGNLAHVSLTAIPVVYSKTHNTAAPTTGSSVWSKWAILRSRRD